MASKEIGTLVLPHHKEQNAGQNSNEFGRGFWAPDENTASFATWILVWGEPDYDHLWAEPIMTIHSLLKLWDNKQMLLEATEFVVICYIATETRYICYTNFTMNFKSNSIWSQFETESKFLIPCL